MKIVRFGHDGRVRYGAVEGDRIEPLEGTIDALTRISQAKWIPLDMVRLLAPVTASKIVIAGLNYSELVRDLKIQPPKEPLLFIKPSTAVIGPNDAIGYPRQTEELFYEGELAIVIARTGRGVSQSQARQHVRVTLA